MSHPLRVTRAALVLLFLFLAGCSGKPAPHTVLRGETMGTWYSITVVAELDAAQQGALQTEVDRLLEIMNSIASTWDAESELSALNRAAAGEWLELSTPLYEMLELSQEISWLSAGAWDPTVGPLLSLWGFGADADQTATPTAPPSVEAIEAALQRTGFQQLKLDLLDQRLMKNRPLVLDLSGIAKGYAVDRISAWLKHRGYQNHLVEVGGEIHVSGLSPRGDAWRIAVESPEPLGGGSVRAVELRDVAVATSGDYRNYYEIDGRRYSHTIDPRSGRPVEHRLASVTVIAPTCAYADAMATALNVLGPEAGMKLAQQHAIAAFFIVRADSGYETMHSPAFAQYLPSEEVSK